MFKNLFSQVSKKRGLAPGELVPVSHKEPIKSECSTYEYSAQEVNFKELGSKINTSFLNTENNLWVNIDGVSDVEYFNEIKNKSLLSSLILEDVMNTSQRSKIEEHDNDLFLVLKMLHLSLIHI